MGSRVKSTRVSKCFLVQRPEDEEAERLTGAQQHDFVKPRWVGVRLPKPTAPCHRPVCEGLNASSCGLNGLFSLGRQADSWSQSTSLQSSMNQQATFQPLRTSVVRLMLPYNKYQCHYGSCTPPTRCNPLLQMPVEARLLFGHVQHGELEAGFSRRTTEDSTYGAQASARAHSNSPHAAAASRRFLATASNGLRGAGAMTWLRTCTSGDWACHGLVCPQA